MVTRTLRASVLTVTVAVAAGILAFAGGFGLLRPKSGPSGAAALIAEDGTPRLLWSADMEEGSLADWYSPRSGPYGDFGGGEYNSDGGVTTVSAEQAHKGSLAARMTLPDGHGGTRLFRWHELRLHQETVQAAWLYFPRRYSRVGGNGQFFNLFQFKSRSSSGAVDPIWYLDVSNPAPDRMRLDLVWWPRTLEGPWPGTSGFRRWTQTVADVPVGRWFEVKARLRQSKDFDGALRVWQDDQVLFDMDGIRTSYATCRFTRWCAENEWSVNNYSDSLMPAPSVIFVDDARIELP
jgi:hypothetical protein